MVYNYYVSEYTHHCISGYKSGPEATMIYNTYYVETVDRFDILQASRRLAMSTGNMAANWRQANDVIAPGWSF